MGWICKRKREKRKRERGRYVEGGMALLEST